MNNFIDGTWRPAYDGEEMDKYNPSTGEFLEKMPASKREDVDAAIDAAEESFDGWSSIGSVARSKIIYRAGELIAKDRKNLENILILENGKIPIEARQEVDGVLDQLQYYAEFSRKITGDIVEGDSNTRRIFQYKIPYGVVVAITPWNFPAGMVARKLAPALLTGNTVVLKPSSDTPASAEFIVRKFIEAGIPKGVLNFLTGKGSEVGDYIIAHPKVSLITMTGSTATGQRIMQKASNNMAKLILELGGKAPFMIWKDANLDNALKAFAWAKLWNSGQSCVAAERLYVHADVYDSFVKRAVSLMKSIVVGNPETSDMGPLINHQALENTEKYISDSILAGLKVIAGGKRPNVPGKFKNGYFLEPTLIEGAEESSRIFRDEIFGPVIGVRKVNDEDEMISEANNSRYGLASYLFTEDQKLIFRASDRIRFGELYVNQPGPESSQGYHTGFRLTGQGGEGSRHGIEEYVKLKNVYVDYSGRVDIESIRKDLFTGL
ncbi:MAG: D-glyceraldehyde dehydrogenase [Thermoplasmataceae archaeon]